MDIKINIVTRIIFITALTFLVANLLGHLIRAILPGRKRKRNSPDFDALVRQKENVLRSKEGIGGKKIITTSKGVKYESRIEELLSKELMRPETGGEKKADITKILSLFDAARWGEGKVFEEVRHKLAATYKVDFSPEKIAKTTNQLKKNNVFITLNCNALISYSEVIDLIGAELFLREILREIAGENSDFLLQFTRRSKTDITSVSKAATVVLSELFGDNISITEIIKKDIRLSPNDPRDYLFMNKRRDVVDTIAISEKIITQATVIKALAPITRPAKGDIKAQLAIFGANEDTGLESISKRYKKLALQLHPDRLSGMDLGVELNKIITENFSVMQEAYNELKKVKK
ncbi:MAG: J domain-containing protein [Bacteriovoracaceae bacterium]|nr:J domain-containing protein [Bacteriovoracaceae bacterium]